MSREVRVLGVCLIMIVITLLSGCAHKPAYSEMNTNRGTAKENQSQANANRGASLSPSSQPSATEPAAASSAATGSTATNSQLAKRPSFLDEARGGIKDLPSYPHASRLNMQMGPNGGLNTLALALQTKDSMDKIAAFYEEVIKTYKWTVVDKLIDPEMSEWNLKKGEDNGAKVQVRKDPASRAMTIVIVRAEKLEENPNSAK